MRELVLTKDQEDVITELYRCHYTAREVSNIVDISYQKVAAIFRGFKVAKIQKYDRLTLIQEPQVKDSLGMASN